MRGLLLALLLAACPSVERLDYDGDGHYDADECGPTDPAIHPGADDPVDPQGIDSNCDGADGVDLDGDGWAGNGDPGDCDDGRPEHFPGADDPFGDGLDQNCDGADGVDADGDGVPPEEGDCDDADADVSPARPDTAGDGFDSNCDGADGVDEDGDGAASEASGGDDCEDDPTVPGAEDIHPGAEDPHGDDIDQNCDGSDGVDADGDGFAAGVEESAECDDDPTRNPLATDVPDNGVDEDCDGLDATCDFDSDGVIDPFCGGEDCDPLSAACGAPADCADFDGDGVDACEGDCDDTEFDISPSWPEACDGFDTDCSGTIPSDEADADGDASRVCDGDCDDGDPSVEPGAPEGCDGVDTDCDGTLGPDEVDGDGDGVLLCADCDDGDDDVYPGAPEICDGVDSDCDGDVDDEEVDSDGDGFTPCDGDCDDGSAEASPLLAELCDGFDTDCDGFELGGGEDSDGDGDLSCAGCDAALDCDDCDDADPVANSLDADADGQSSCDGDCNDASILESGLDSDADGFDSCDEGDCNDFNPAIHPGAPEGCDGLDNDCVDGPDASEADTDSDTWFACAECDDTNAAVYPGATELCDGLDNDCDGETDDAELDVDADSWVACGPWVGTDPAIVDGDDCDDFEFTANPGESADGCDNIDNNCDGAFDEDGDVDGDGWCLGECDDGDDGVHPLIWEPGLLDDGIDNDCDGDPTTTGLEWGDALILGGPGERLGVCASNVGDLDGDGFDELLLGDTNHSAVLTEDGKVWIFSGALLADRAQNRGVLTTADAWVTMEGESEMSWLCHGVSAGDLDGDGVDDLLLSAPGWRTSSTFARGRVYAILSTQLTGGPFPLSAAHALVEPPAGQSQLLGLKMVGGGSVDGDERADVALVAPWAAGRAGQVYVFTGAQLAVGGTFSPDDAHFTLAGDGLQEEELADSVVWLGDLDGDGADELAASQEEEFPEYVFVIPGAMIAAGGAMSSLDAPLKLEGDSNQGMALHAHGAGMAVLGDVTGDGLPELAIGASGADVAFQNDGSVHLVSGAEIADRLPGGPSQTAVYDLAYRQAGHRGWGMLGEGLSQRLGGAMWNLGDTDGDGLDDLVVLAEGDDLWAVLPGAAWSNLGADAVDRVTVGSLPWRFADPGGADSAQVAVPLGDLDGDGRADVAFVDYAQDNGSGGSDGRTTILLSQAE